MVSRFPAAFQPPAFASWPSCSRREIGLPHGQPTGPAGPDPVGVSTFRTLEQRPGWAPSIPRGRWCPPARGSFPAGTRRFPAASPCIPLEHSAWRGPNVTRPHQGFTRVHPSGLPLACGPRTERGPLGVFSELRTPPLPAAHVRAGTGPGHWPGITPSASAGLLPVNPLNLCDLVSHRPGVARPQHHRQGFPGRLGAVVGERAQGMEAIGFLPRRGGFLLV